jgi:hypothetical protein
MKIEEMIWKKSIMENKGMIPQKKKWKLQDDKRRYRRIISMDYRRCNK